MSLDGLNMLAIGYFKGNIWAEETKFSGAFFFDERANEKQREALNMIFTGKAGGFMAEFAKLLGEVKGMDYAPMTLRDLRTMQVVTITIILKSCWNITSKKV